MNARPNLIICTSRDTVPPPLGEFDQPSKPCDIRSIFSSIEPVDVILLSVCFLLFRIPNQYSEKQTLTLHQHTLVYVLESSMRLKIKVKIPVFASCCREWLTDCHQTFKSGKHTLFRPIRISYTPDSIMAALAITHMQHVTTQPPWQQDSYKQ